MQQRLWEVTEELDDARETLAEAYDGLAVYRLRVSARRIRSILKHRDGEKARRLRKEWRGFVAVTGDARDWDVFLADAGALLTEDELRAFSETNQARIREAHEAVMAMLGSDDWREHLAKWRGYLASEQNGSGAGRDGAETLLAAIEQARHRLHRALDHDSDRRWHKFRIAIKEVRYVAEAHAELPGAEAVLLRCKELQELLGSWHDTVVQLHLLDSLPETPEHDRLMILVSRRKHGYLSSLLDGLSGAALFADEEEGVRQGVPGGGRNTPRSA